MTVDELRKDLSDIRYYYSRKAMFDRAADCVAKNAAIALAERYNGVIWNAPPRLYDLYISLYIENSTQASLAEKWGYSESHIRYLTRQLYAFLQGAFTDGFKMGKEHQRTGFFCFGRIGGCSAHFIGKVIGRSRRGRSFSRGF